MQAWIDLFRSLGESLVEVWRAEVASLQGDLERSGRQLGLALAFFGAVAVLGFWIVGLFLFVTIAVLHIWLPWWAAAGIMLFLFAVAAFVLAVLGKRRLSHFENPVSTVRRRVDNHLDWWQHGLLAKPQTLDVEGATVASRGEEPPGGGRNLP
ncbi:MAG TPA: phage holin family protein [Thermoanaerobaculia bacterium]